jgi:hypothetical protein
MSKPRKKKKKLFTSKKRDNTKFINARREKNALAKSNPIIAQKPTTSSPTSQKQSPPSSSSKKKRNVSPPQLDHAFISKLKSKSSPTHIILPPKNEPCTGQTLDMLDTKISSPKLRDAIAKGLFLKQVFPELLCMIIIIKPQPSIRETFWPPHLRDYQFQ